jgi:hypothetical protein
MGAWRETASRAHTPGRWPRTMSPDTFSQVSATTCTRTSLLYRGLLRNSYRVNIVIEGFGHPRPRQHAQVFDAACIAHCARHHDAHCKSGITRELDRFGKTFSPIISPTKTRLVFWGEAKNGQHGGAVRKEGTAQWAGRGGDEHRAAGARRRNVAGGGPVRRRESFRLAHMQKSTLLNKL